MMLCEGPFWQHDDLSQCFQTVYLQIAFPMIICACSSLLILLRAGFFARSKAGKASTRVSSSGRRESDEVQSSLAGGAGSTAKDGSEPGDVDRSKWLWPFRSSKFELIPTKKVFRSGRFAIAETSVEVCCLIGELVIHAVALLTLVEPRFRDPHASPLLLSTIPWLYITSLAVLSIVNQNLAEGNLSLDVELSYHRTTFYCLQGIFTAARFRSTAIHPSSIAIRTATSLEFALNIVLILNALFASNRGSNFDDPLSSLKSSGELSSSIISNATFTWVDTLIWRRETKDYEISNLWDLLPRDKAFFIMIGFRKNGAASKLMWKLIRDSRSNLLIQGMWAAVSGLSTFLPTLLLKAILQYVEDPADKSSNNGWLLVMLLFIAGCMKSIADGQASWMGRKIYVRLRAIIVGELYSKLLTRKASALCAYELREDEDQRASANVVKVQQHSAGRDNGSSPGSGQIMTLMAVDSVKVGDLGASLHVLVTKAPIELLLGIILLYKILGYSSIAALCILGLLTPLRIWLARGFREIQVEVMAATDARVQSTNEVLQNIRLIKYFAWESRFIHRIDQARHLELQWLRRRFLLMTFASAVQSAAPILMAVLSFLSYTMLEEKILIPSVAFASLSLFNLLRGPLDQLSDTLAKVQESMISINRVEKFLCQKSMEKSSQHVSELDNEEEERDMGFHNATLSWGDDWHSGSFRLTDINVQFQTNSLNIIVGPTGSGKSSLLLALLGEMTLLSGNVYLPQSNKSEPSMFDQAVDNPPRVAYCSQQAWLRNDCIKHNILFANPWNYERYQCVLEACCLLQDLQILPLGDNTMVGEKGVKLSGGQKQRIALARAVYSGAPTVLLDDCLSAVDSHTCKLIFERCLKGPLMHKRSCVLVTNNVALCAPHSELVVVVQDGRVYKQGRPEEVCSSGALSASCDENTSSSTLDCLKATFSGSDSERNEQNSVRSSQTAHSSNEGAENDSTVNKDLAESRPEGAVRGRLIQLYLSSMGAWYYWLGMIILFFATQLGTVAKDMWVRKWANQHTVSLEYRLQQGHTHAPDRGFQQQGIKNEAELYSRFSGVALSPAVAMERFDAFYLQVFALLGLISVGLRVVRYGFQYTGSLSGSKVLHHRLLVQILRAKFTFFDVTPLGRILNRFSKDIEVIDQGVAHVLFGFQNALFSVITVWLVISAVTPVFLPPSLLVFLIYFCIGKLYVKSSRSLKRLEAVQRSPLYQHFDETLAGVITIRAYGAESRFMRQSLETLDAHTRPWLYLWATNNWLTFRVEFLSACITFIVGALVIWNAKKVDPGAAGLSLTYAVSFTDHVLWLVRLYASTEIHMNCVERVEEYIDAPQEAASEVSENRPAGDWPRHGSIQFINYTTKYKNDLPPVLKDLTFKVNAGEKIGIVGRTGAGKSSLALSIFRGLESVGGQILIDGVDIKGIGLDPLRNAMTVVPQDTGLFSGTVRTNLDPFELFTDEELFAALRHVKLIHSPMNKYGSRVTAMDSEAAMSSPNEEDRDLVHENRNVFHDLASPILDSGANIAQGQRQLLCLARALLRDTKILIMDEPTASLDHDTDTKLQETISGLTCTVLTIAHRLQTIIEYDKVLVLELGEVVEYDEPWTLLRKDGGVFRRMCEASGDFELLERMAREKWKIRRLVDDSLP